MGSLDTCTKIRKWDIANGVEIWENVKTKEAYGESVMVDEYILINQWKTRENRKEMP